MKISKAMNKLSKKTIWLICITLTIVQLPATALDKSLDRKQYPETIQRLLKDTTPLVHPRGDRLPLFLWPAHQGAVADPKLQEQLISDLNSHGIAVISTWKSGNQEQHLASAQRIAKAQKKLDLMVCVNANDCMYGFFDGSADTGHVDEKGNIFFDDSIPGDQIGCPFRIAHKYEQQKKKIADYVDAYQQLSLPLNFVFGDWEIDGPLEINREWESSKRCVVCRENIPNLNNFTSFQRSVRTERCDATRECFSRPILNAYPSALVGNYGVYPNNGTRYWYDYFETFYERHPHVMDQKAPYRRWVNDYPMSGYTFAMPVIYTWSRTFQWYNFSDPDYRWFYNMLLVGSNACKHTDPSVPIVPFVHWHTVFESGSSDPSVSQLSRTMYQELLWHLLLCGVDSFFMWCVPEEEAVESALVHEVWSDALAYREWLVQGTPINFDVPSEQGPVVSGLRRGDRVLIRRTDFGGGQTHPIQITVGNRKVTISPGSGCQILQLN
jgi:hypothetical protein